MSAKNLSNQMKVKSRLSAWEDEHEILLSTFLSQSNEETQNSDSVNPAQPNRDVTLNEQTETQQT